MFGLSSSAERILSPATLTHPADVRSVPAEPGIYGWWIRVGSLEVPIADYRQHDDFELLYVGIAPRKPSTDGRLSKSNLRKRLNQHVNGNASRSTLRRTLGVLLMEPLGLTLGRLRPNNSDGGLVFKPSDDLFKLSTEPGPRPVEVQRLSTDPVTLNNDVQIGLIRSVSTGIEQ